MKLHKRVINKPFPGVRYWFVMALFFFPPGSLWASPPEGASPEEQGRNVFVTQDRMDTDYQDAVAKMTMTLVNAAGQESLRKMIYRTLEVLDDGDKTMITFEHPRDIKGTSLLTFEHADREDDQWLFLPALKRVKRIASKNKSGSFVGSEFSYEDISSNEPAKYDYKFLREDKVEGVDAWVIERVPLDPNSGYTRIVSWVDQSNYQILKEEYFDRKGSPLKVQVNNGNKLYLGKFWRPSEIIMENLQTRKKSVLNFEDWGFRKGLKESYFTKRSLERQR